MRFKSFSGVLIACACLFGGVSTWAQQLPPIEPPKPMPGAQGEAPSLRVTTTEVLVPTLVEAKNGGILYGLKPTDFVLEDNGVPQKIRVQPELDSAPVALVVAVQEGGASLLEFDKFARLGPLLDVFMFDKRSQVALVGFDSKQHLIHDFTHSSDAVEEDLKELQPGNGGAAILDTMNYAVALEEEQPKEYRRVVLLISEERDHGSRHTKPVDLIKRIGESDVLVLSVSFSPAMAQFTESMRGPYYGQTTPAHTPTPGLTEQTAGGNLLAPLAMLVQALRKNVTKEIAELSGGEYAQFVTDKRFEAEIMTAARDARNRYLITFSPSDPTPGLHSIRVRTVEDYGARIVARANYWREAGK
ncbi:MAG TPA: VWA domain-containing protein [Terracidiphilus sp.]|jgi:VWFA-related protein